MFDRNDNLRDALKRAASAFKAHGPRFALAGSYALWVYGRPNPCTMSISWWPRATPRRPR